MRSAGPDLPPDPGPTIEQAPSATQGAGASKCEATTTRRLRSHELFAGLAEVEIEHGPFVYRLRRTALGKLILTK